MKNIYAKLNKEEGDLVAAIAERAIQCSGGNKVSVLMDLIVCHNQCPLRLKDLLCADDLNFLHDISGINRHLNHETGELMNCFQPRFAAPLPKHHKKLITLINRYHVMELEINEIDDTYCSDEIPQKLLNRMDRYYDKQYCISQQIQDLKKKFSNAADFYRAVDNSDQSRASWIYSHNHS